VDQENSNFKKEYYELLRELGRTEHRLRCERCPPFKQCCAACNLIKDLIKKEKNKEKNEFINN